MCSSLEVFDLWNSLESDSHQDESDKGHAITSESNEVAETTGGRVVSRSLVHSNPSFSFNTRRRSWMERSRAASRDMLAVVGRGAMGNV